MSPCVRRASYQVRHHALEPLAIAAALLAGCRYERSLGGPPDEAVDALSVDAVTGLGHRAYIKASNPDTNDSFASDVALSADGSTLAVGASGEDSAATGID